MCIRDSFISSVTYQKTEDLVPFLFEQGKNPFFVMLDGVTDVRNFGAKMCIRDRSIRERIETERKRKIKLLLLLLVEFFSGELLLLILLCFFRKSDVYKRQQQVPTVRLWLPVTTVVSCRKDILLTSWCK